MVSVHVISKFKIITSHPMHYKIINCPNASDRQTDKQTNKQTNKQTTRSRVPPETLPGPQLVKKFPTFYGTRRFITAFTTAHHMSLPARMRLVTFSVLSTRHVSFKNGPSLNLFTTEQEREDVLGYGAT
jgi:hypothetical protein